MMNHARGRRSLGTWFETWDRCAYKWATWTTCDPKIKLVTNQNSFVSLKVQSQLAPINHKVKCWKTKYDRRAILLPSDSYQPPSTESHSTWVTLPLWWIGANWDWTLRQTKLLWFVTNFIFLINMFCLSIQAVHIGHLYVHLLKSQINFSRTSDKRFLVTE